MSSWPLAVVVSGFVREAARLENSDWVAEASLRALSAMGPLERDWTVLLFFKESIVDWAPSGGLEGWIGSGESAGRNYWFVLACVMNVG